MPELSVAVFATDNDQRAVLQVLVDGTSVARTICGNSTMPLAASDPVIRRTQGFAPDVVLVDIATDGVTSALRAIELLHQELPDSAVFAVGPMTQPQLIVSAMRAGVREYINAPLPRPICWKPSSACRQLAVSQDVKVRAERCSRL
jgi:CheY-like chemotaxis protein